MNESILDSIKELLGIVPECTDFDSIIKIHINTVFGILRQIGCGPDDGFVITGSTEVWTDFIGESTKLEFVKSYVGLKVKSMFDPPNSGVVSESLNNAMKELEWRISVTVDPGKE